MKRYITTFLALLTMAVSLLLLAQFELPRVGGSCIGLCGFAGHPQSGHQRR